MQAQLRLDCICVLVGECAFLEHLAAIQPTDSISQLWSAFCSSSTVTVTVGGVGRCTVPSEVRGACLVGC